MQHGTRFEKVILVGTLVLGTTISAGAQPGAGVVPPPFQIEWQVQGTGGDAVVKGSVQNHMQVRVTDVRLRVEVLDGGGAVVADSFGWVLGDVPAAGTGYFVVPLTATGAQYRITVVSFDEVSRTTGGGSASP